MTERRHDVQIRGVPSDIRARLRKRSAIKGVSMSRYVIDVLRDDLSRPTRAEWFEEIRNLGFPPIEGIDAAELVREIRREAEEGRDL